MHPQVTSCQDCWQDYWHRIQILRSVACKNHPWSSTATGICSFQSYLRRFWLTSNTWEYVRISSPTSRSPEGVITWGGGVPKESSGHTWVHFETFQKVECLLIYLSANLTWTLLVQPVIYGGVWWVGWKLKEILLNVLKHADVAGTLLLCSSDG